MGYLWLARLSRLAARAPPELAQGLGRIVLSVLAIFCKKWDHFFGGGMPPVVAPEGDLVFWGKSSYPFIDSKEFTFVQPTGVLGM
jgi:hypothetical protein